MTEQADETADIEDPVFMKNLTAPLGVLALALAACTSEPAAQPDPQTTSPAAATAGVAPGTFDLAPLTQEEIAKAALPGEFGCAFGVDEQPFLFARAFAGDNERGAGIMKVNSFVEKIQTAHTGGFDAMAQKGEFEGRGLTIDVETSGDNLSEMEGSRFAANMTVTRVGADPQVLDGFWNCGP